MKLILLLLQFMALPHLVQAAQHCKDTVPPAREELLKALELTDEQKAAIKLLVVEYKLKERAQRKELKRRIAALLTKQQKHKLKIIIRRHL
jgi:hypothetical protein